jgi:hypothetical protein
MAGPNQTGTTLQSPMSAELGYGTSLMNQVSDEELARRKKALQAAGSGQNTPVSGGLGYSSASPTPYGGYQAPGG